MLSIGILFAIKYFSKVSLNFNKYLYIQSFSVYKNQFAIIFIFNHHSSTRSKRTERIIEVFYTEANINQFCPSFRRCAHEYVMLVEKIVCSVKRAISLNQLPSSSYNKVI